MLKSIVFIVLTVLTVTYIGSGEAVKLKFQKSIITPYTLWDQAMAKLDQLRLVVNSAILAAHSQFDEIQDNYDNYAQGVESKTEDQIREEAQINAGYVNDIKDLAAAVSADIEVCLRVRESYLERLPDVTILNLQQCISNVGKGAQDDINEGKRAVDSNIEFLNDLEAQLRSCVTGSIICVDPVIRAIDAAMIQKPESIQLQVQATRNIVNTLTLQVDECGSSQLSTYVTSASSVVGDIEACANRII